MKRNSCKSSRNSSKHSDKSRSRSKKSSTSSRKQRGSSSSRPPTSPSGRSSALKKSNQKTGESAYSPISPSPAEMMKFQCMTRYPQPQQQAKSVKSGEPNAKVATSTKMTNTRLNRVEAFVPDIQTPRSKWEASQIPYVQYPDSSRKFFKLEEKVDGANCLEQPSLKNVSSSRSESSDTGSSRSTTETESLSERDNGNSASSKSSTSQSVVSTDEFETPKRSIPSDSLSSRTSSASERSEIDVTRPPKTSLPQARRITPSSRNLIESRPMRNISQPESFDRARKPMPLVAQPRAIFRVGVLGKPDSGVFAARQAICENFPNPAYYIPFPLEDVCDLNTRVVRMGEFEMELVLETNVKCFSYWPNMLNNWFDGFIVFFELRDFDGFRGSLEGWVYAAKVLYPGKPIIVCGTGAEHRGKEAGVGKLKKKSSMLIPQSFAKEEALRRGVSYMEISTSSKDQVDEVFAEMLATCSENAEKRMRTLRPRKTRPPIISKSSASKGSDSKKGGGGAASKQRSIRFVTNYN